MSEMGSVYPGGPARPREGSDATSLRPGEDVDQARLMGAARYRRRARTRRVRIGFAVALVLSAAAGFALGLQSHRTPEELARAMDPDESLGGLLQSERKIILQELWQMEMEDRRGPAR